ncbi:DinB family protein [Pseudonocardia sp.]|uniref:DinB family protein n=1 Tax=Pseudonocardia sp. TaxID=60912 RepID=UPI0031FE0FF4
MGEKSELLEQLAHHRSMLRVTVQGLSDEQATRRTTVSELTLAGILKHVTYAERLWIDFVVEGSKVDDMDRYAASFRMEPGETLDGLLADYDAVAERTEKVAADLPSLDVAHRLPTAPWYPPDTSWSARQVLIHILAETAQHAGHADILRESLDGARTMA